MQEPFLRRRAIYAVACLVGVLALATLHRVSAASANLPIVFQRWDGNDYELFTVLSDGAGEVRLTDNGTDDFDPAWSPDHTRIAFTRWDRRHATNVLWAMNADGSGKLRLTGIHRFAFQPDWSPDGSRIVHSRNVEGELEIFTIASAGRSPIQLTHDALIDQFRRTTIERRIGRPTDRRSSSRASATGTRRSTSRTPTGRARCG